MDNSETITPEEEKAIEVILSAPLETDQDYINLARLIDEAVSDESE
jgi:hypothetical protein